jgi:hypothetical protein
MSEVNIFTYLDEMRDRPTMYVRSLLDLEAQIYGYYAALKNHRVVESGPSMTHHFLVWGYFRKHWSTCAFGWARAIESRISSLDEQLRKFFALVDEYRQLRPTPLCSVRLKRHHVPTGKRVVIGLGGRMEKPCRVEIFRYKPEPLHFLRFHYGNRIEDDWLLMKSDGTNNTTLGDAKRWVRDELQVKRDEWQKTSGE